MLPIFSIGQTDPWLKTIKYNHIGKEFSFVKSKHTKVDGKQIYYYDSLVLIYLGKVRTKNGRTLKIMTSRWYWGSVPRATSRIIIFNNKNQYVGDYYLTMTYDIPDKIEGNSIVFINDKTSGCDTNLITKISFRNGIPKKILVNCSEKSLDIYVFENV